MSNRKFYKYVYKIMVVTDRKSNPDLDSLIYDINESEAMMVSSGTRVKLDAKEAIDALAEMGYDPSWMSLDKDGNDTDNP